MNRSSKITNIIIYFTIIFLGILFLFPFYWMLRTAVVSSGRIFSSELEILPPEIFMENFQSALTTMPFSLYFLNTTIITLLNIIGVLLTSSLCAYGFSRIEWPGRNIIFGIIMTALMLPYSVLMIPHFIGYSFLGITDTFLPLIIPAFFGGGVFNIFLLRQFFLLIPMEMNEAAFIDGANHLKVYWLIILPLSKQVLIIVGLFTFLLNWNDYLAPMIYITSEKNFTLMLGLNQFMGGYNAQWNLMMAAVSVIVLPSLIIYFIAQKTFYRRYCYDRDKRLKTSDIHNIKDM